MASTGVKPTYYDHDKWGWVMVAAVFVNCFVIVGQIKSFGVLLIPMANDLDSDLWLVGWIAGLHVMAQNSIAPLAGALSRLFGSRPMMVIGGLSYTLGLILSSMSPSIPFLSIFIIGLSGIGSAFNFFIGSAVMASYFKEKYPLAIGIATMGFPLGMMIYGPVTQVLLDTYGWRGTMLLLGGVSFHLVPCAMLARRDPSFSSPDSQQYQEVSVSDEEDADAMEEQTVCSDGKPTTPKGRSRSNLDLRKSRLRECCQRITDALDLALLKDRRFVLLVFARLTGALAYSPLVVYVVTHGQFQGLTLIQASFLPTAFGFGNVIGKLVAPILQQVGVKPSMTFWACFGASVVCASFLLDAFIRPFIGQLTLAGLIGVGYATMFQANDVMLRFLSTDDRLVSMLCWQGFFIGLTAALGGLVAGWIYEWTGSFSISFCLFGGVTLLSIPLFIAEAVYAKRRAPLQG
ncbi:monocarboxylate transporter 5-like [Patiria miniata]|uniref:Major facilitator superfamily (MFS) profile domain-containing protein n=1 Tax=Patiria miniata TaxID=46514 RepID=A0A913ZQF9_PATMI|nr:monocarboxylate transporter 5-like [Patiria miniata]